MAISKYTPITPGCKFGRLTVVASAPRIKLEIAWLCKCDCGGEKVIRQTLLNAGRTKSCGCIVHETAGHFNPIPLGTRFGRLVVESEVLVTSGGVRRQWNCRCDCGKLVVVPRSNLMSGNSRSCGCYRRDMALASITTHGLSKSRTYEIWAGMRKRCENPRSTKYLIYGARGIKVCERWKDFANFLKDMGEAPLDRSIDRIDNDGDYTPANCRWATTKEQANNKSNSRFVTWRGETRTITEWAAKLGLNSGSLISRLQRGWDIERIFTQPFRTSRQQAQ